MGKLFLTIKIGLGLLLALCLIQLFAGAGPGSGPWSPTSTSRGGTPRPARTDPLDPPPAAPVDHSVLARSDLFGRPAASGGQSDAVTASPAPGPLPYGDVSLIGTVAGNKALARALFKEGSQQAPLLRALGDSIAGGTLVQIDKTSVVINFEGERVTLYIDNQRPAEATPAPVQAAPALPYRRVIDVPPVQSPARRRIAQVESFLGAATLSHHVVNGWVEGIRVDHVDQLPQAERFGLENGDIVRVINGQTLTSKQKAFQVLKKARSQAAMDIEIERNGKTKHLSLPLD